MAYFVCALIGYLLGSINLAWIISKLKGKNIENSGTGNLGTTNTFINFGKGYGVCVLIADFAKAIFAVKLCEWLFPELVLASVIAGCMAIIGHIFPFYNHFRGGKGIACLGGFIMSIDIRYFVILLALGLALSVVFNYGCCISFSASVAFPFIYAIQLQSLAAFFALAITSMAIIYKHMDNVRKIRAGEEMKIRVFLHRYIWGTENKNSCEKNKHDRKTQQS